MKFAGAMWAKTIEVRFTASGKLVNVRKHTGDNVTKGEVLASLDRQLLQSDLDTQLADFEKTKADFEIFDLKYKGSPDPIIKLQKSSQQASLNTAVKEVEQAKYRLDQADLITPISGIILDDGNCVTGLNITPSANAFTVLDSASKVFRANINPKDVSHFATSMSLPVDFPEVGKKLFGKSSLPRLNNKLEYVVDVILDDNPDLPIGLSGILLLP